MNELENGMVLTDYTPMLDSDKPVLVCSWCGCVGISKKEG